MNIRCQSWLVSASLISVTNILGTTNPTFASSLGLIELFLFPAQTREGTDPQEEQQGQKKKKSSSLQIWTQRPQRTFSFPTLNGDFFWHSRSSTSSNRRPFGRGRRRRRRLPWLVRLIIAYRIVVIFVPDAPLVGTSLLASN